VIRLPATSPEGAGSLVVLGSPTHARGAWWIPDEERREVQPLASWPLAARVVENRQDGFVVESLPSFGRSGGRRFVVPSVFATPLGATYLSDIYTSSVGETTLAPARSTAARPLWNSAGVLCGTERRCARINRERTRRPVSFEALVAGEPLERRAMTLAPAEYNALIERVYCSHMPIPPSTNPSDQRVVPIEDARFAAAVLTCASAHGEDGYAQIVGWIAKGAPIVTATPSPPRVVAAMREASQRVRLWMRENVVAPARGLGEAPLASSPGVTVSVVVAGEEVFALMADATAVRATVLSDWHDGTLPTQVRFADFDGDGLTDVLLHGRLTRGPHSYAGGVVYLAREPGAGLFGDFERDYGTQPLLGTDSPDEAVQRALAYRPVEFDRRTALAFLDSAALRALRASADRESRRGFGRALNYRPAIAAIRARRAVGARLVDTSATDALWTTPTVNTTSVDEWIEDFLTRNEQIRPAYFVCRPSRGYCVSLENRRPEVVFNFAVEPQRGPVLSSITMVDSVP
jgi:hypothetical protein